MAREGGVLPRHRSLEAAVLGAGGRVVAVLAGHLPEGRGG